MPNSESKLVPSNTDGTLGSSKSGVSPSAHPQVTLSASLDSPQMVPGTSAFEPQTMLSHSAPGAHSSAVPQTMLSHSAVSHCVPHTMLSHSSVSHCVPHTML